jgi:hypothetical protein
MKFPEQDVNALLEGVKKIGRTVEAQAAIELQVISTYDYAFYKCVERADGEKKAKEAHKKVWLKHVLDYIKEGELDLGISGVKDILTLGLITKLAFERRGCIFEVVEITPERFVGVITRDALKEIAEEAFKEKPGGAYMKSLAAASSAIINQLVEECGLGKVVKAEQDKSLFLGDDMTRIIYSKK